MKKTILCLMSAILLLTCIPHDSQGASDKIKTEKSVNPQSEEAKILIDRLKEIEAMDKSNLSREEKRTLRKEVRVIEKKLHEVTYVYISAGAIIIIILLLIILL